MDERWLPSNFHGPRTAAEARDDLRAIARWPDTSEAHVAVEAGGSSSRLRGFVTVAEAPDQGESLDVAVDGASVFTFRPAEFTSANLQTLDGADYYELIIETVAGRLHLRDAYNGL